MAAIQNSYGKPDPVEPYVAKIVKLNLHPNNKIPNLELQVKIEGRDRTVSLPLYALQEFGIGGPAAVEELRGLRMALERIASTYPSSASEPSETG